MEYVPGGSISALLRKFGRFDEPLVQVYARQMVLGLEYLHRHRCVCALRVCVCMCLFVWVFVCAQI